MQNGFGQMSTRTKRIVALIGAIVALTMIGLGIWGIVAADSREPAESSNMGDSGKLVATVDSSDVNLPDYYAPGMVLQRDKPLRIRGTLSSTVTTANIPDFTVSVEYDGAPAVSGVARRDGSGFVADLPALTGSTRPGTLKVSAGGRTLREISPVYVGDVFVAAGQSNIELNVAQYYASDAGRKVNLEDVFTVKDLPKLINDKNVHFIATDRKTDTKAYPVIAENKNGWLTATGKNTEHLSFLAQQFAQQLRTRDREIPVGIIQTAWGGTAISDHVKGGDIYESHIAPLKDYRVAGVLWYQGCNDAAYESTALEYETNFVGLINQYRVVFGEDDLPFLYVQLARFNGRSTYPLIYLPELRQAQMKTLGNAALRNAKNVGMTVSIDTDKGTSGVIHPLGKDIIASRMAQQWWAMTGKSDADADSTGSALVPSSPIAVGMSRDAGGNATVSFAPGTALGLQARAPLYTKEAVPSHVSDATATPIEGVRVSDFDGQFVDADSAVIAGDKLVVSSSKVKNIRQVSYLWDRNPQSRSMIYNQWGLPASPFVVGS